MARIHVLNSSTAGCPRRDLQEDAITARHLQHSVEDVPGFEQLPTTTLESQIGPNKAT